MVSPVHREEIEAISDSFERIELQASLATLGQSIKADMAAIRRRAEELTDLRFGVADAAHVGFAEQCDAEFVSCDDALIRKCSKHKIGVWCGSPVSFYEKEALR